MADQKSNLKLSRTSDDKSLVDNKVKSASKLRGFMWIIFLILAALVALFAVITNMALPCDRTVNTYKNVEVKDGDSISDVAKTLEKEGIIKNAERFETIARLSRTVNPRPGLYPLSPSMNSVEIARTVVNGISTSNGFTIPNGYNLDQIASALERDGIADKEAFMEAAKSKDLQEFEIIGENKLGSYQVEGFLFPGSYIIGYDADENMLIMTMLNQFDLFFNDDYRARADELGLSIRELVYIASMIELETNIDKEKPAVSAVIHNRYNLEMLSKDDIKQAPLCNPGEQSILAALYPEDNDNIYYVYSAKRDGTHVFTADEEEYNRLTEEYKQASEAE